jgi:ATP phosphoribosyltransferase regulatory subunit
MNKVLLHTPEGVRDIYGKECAVKLTIENKINKVFNIYGYHDIQTPTFEFFDIFSKERGSVASKNLYKFFDREGNTLVLRPDVTPSIARLAAKYYMDVNVPVKLCYNANTYVNNSELQGKLKETTQLGCELINDNSIEADAEMIALAVESIKASGIDKFLVEIGHVDFYNGLIDESRLDMESEIRLREMILNKNDFGVEEILNENNVTGEIKEAMLKLPELFGSVEILEQAKSLTDNEKALNAIKRLEKLYSILEDYGVSKYISFDLASLSNYGYYTGIIFKGFTYGTGEPISAGGRYDKLLSQFGKNAAAVGFAIYMDQIMIAHSGNIAKTDYEYEVIIYEPEFRKYAFSLANDLRNSGIKTELIPKKKDIPIEEYKEFKLKDGALKITYVSKDGVIKL